MAEAAPDEQVLRAGRKLAVPAPWQEVGVSGNLLWGQCRGSGAKPYQVSIDTAAPAWRCSCPSRKFPCKHSVALLLLWAQGNVSATDGIAAFAEKWSAGRESRAAARKTAGERASSRTPEQQAAAAQSAAKRAAQRDQRVDDGLAELDRWLRDQISQGLATHSADRFGELRRMTARMVDAQAPAVAVELEQLTRITDAVADWPAQLMAGYARLRLLIRAWQRRAELPEDLMATVRNHIGFTVRAEDVVAEQPGVADHWAVLGQVDSHEDRLSVRRVWMHGQRSGRWALVLFFAAAGASLASNLIPGTAVDATLHFHPGRLPLRATVGEQTSDAQPIGLWDPPSTTPADVRDQWRAALAADPWCRDLPVWVTGRVRRADDQFSIADADDGLPLLGPAAWRAAVLADSRTAHVCGELTSHGLTPTAVVTGQKVRLL